MLTILFQILQASIVYMCVFLCDLLWPKKQLTRFEIQYGLKVHVSKGNDSIIKYGMGNRMIPLTIIY